MKCKTIRRRRADGTRDILPAIREGDKLLKKLFSLWLFVALPTMAQTVAIRAGNVIDPATGSVAKNQVIVVENGKITAIGGNLAIPKEAQVVDLSNEWVMPGLIDAHTHITFQEIPGKAPFEAMYLKESSAFRALQGVHFAGMLLNAGFTTVRDVGNEADYACMEVKKTVRDGWFDGPTIQCAGKIIGPFGGQSKGMPEEVGGFWLHEYIDADSPAEIVKAIHQNIYYGADVIKLATDNSD